MKQLGKDKIQLLRQALVSASSSIKLANQILNDVERMGGATELPGLVGRYDGRFMVTEAGKKYPVPDNYSAKTKLVYNDRLKMVEGPRGRQFKLVEKVSRVEVEAQLVEKDDQFEALTKDGSHKLLQSAVKYWSGAEGDKVKIRLPEGEKNVPFAALVEIVGKTPGGAKEEPKKSEGEKPKKKEEEKAKAPAKKTRTEKKAAPKKKTTTKKASAPAKKKTSTKAKAGKEKPKKEEPIGEEELR